MSSPNAPNTSGISAGIVTLLANAPFTLTLGQVGYKKAMQGRLKDVTDLIPCATVEAARGTAGPYSAGGTAIGWKAEDEPVFRITSYVDDSDAETSEKDIVLIRDAIIPIFLNPKALANLPVQNVYKNVVVPDSEQYLYRDMQNGVIYRAHQFLVRVYQQYNLYLTS